MRIINSPQFTTSSLVWQEQPEQWSLTLVCKATFSLKPGLAELATEPEGINEQDNHWDDDPQKSVYAPSDLAPYKPSPEILLVGSAYAPRKEPVRSLFARVIIGPFDKSIEVFGARTIAPDGSLVDGPRWTQMSLRYERAAGGENSWNPVGVDASVRDAYGRRTLPNLQPPALVEGERSNSIPAVGFGPIAARWPMRQEKLGALADAFLENRWTSTPLTAEFDGTYFQSAPRDQFIEEIRADETIVLENLHPDIERLVTRLPGIKPRTRIEIEGLPPWELVLTPDTLWIDTNRATCTLTFRSQLPLDGRDQAGTIYIGVEYPGEPVRFPEMPARPPVPMVSVTDAVVEMDDFDLTQTNANSLEPERQTALPFVPPKPHVLPWDPGATPVSPAPAPRAAPPPPPPKRDEDSFGETSVFPAPTGKGRMPTWLGTGSLDAPAATPVPVSAQGLRKTAELPRVHPHTPRAPIAAPPPVAQMLRSNEVAPSSLANASHRAAGLEGTNQRPGGLGAPPIAPPLSHSRPPAGPPMPVAQPTGFAAPPPIRPSTSTLPGVVVPPMPVAPVPPLSTPGTTFGQAAVLAAAKAQTTLPTTSTSQGIVGPAAQLDKDRSRAGKPDAAVLATAAFLGATEASNAAAIAPEETDDKLPAEKSLATTSGPVPGRTLIDLLWFDPGLPPRVREHASWKRLLEDPAATEEKPRVDEDGFLEPDLTRPQKRRPPPPPEKTAEERAKEDKSQVSKVVSRATPTVDIDNALYSAINDDGVLAPPLCVVAGDIELPFDEVETLKVLTRAAAPLATGDKKLKETIDLANEALGTPLGESPEVAANFSMRIREAWTKANRLLPADYLDVHSRRVLLEQRKYQKRELVGEPWIRALLHGVFGDRGVPTYLPADIAKKLPLFTRFAVRLIVEVLPQQDQYEVHPLALRVHALARMIAGRSRR